MSAPGGPDSHDYLDDGFARRDADRNRHDPADGGKPRERASGSAAGGGVERPTVSELIRGGEMTLLINGVPNARRNAEWMLAHVLACRSADLYLDTSHRPSQGEVRRYRSFIDRRSQREPLQYILGNTEFMSLSFDTVPGVFIPRPDTECLVELAEQLLLSHDPHAGAGHQRDAVGHRAPRVVFDICSGSGVIGVSLAYRVPDVHVTAIDINPEAVALTARNAERNGVAGRLAALEREGIAFVGSPGVLADMIVCNPPYISARELAALPPEVARHEPRASLDGGPDGLGFYRAFAGPAFAALSPGGFLLLEIGCEQAADVSSVLESASFVDIEVHRDYAVRDRVVVARRPFQIPHG